MTIQLRPEIETLKDTIIATRRDIHKHPELAFDEHRTSKLAADRLEALGIEVQTGVGKTGVVGTLSGNNDGKTRTFGRAFAGKAGRILGTNGGLVWRIH